MNGVRAIFMRKGYLLTALAAAALLAASPGTASAQNTTGVTITGPSLSTVNEGGTATYTVAISGYIPKAVDGNNDGEISADEDVDAGNVTVTLAVSNDTTTASTAGDDGDVNTNTGVSVSFPVQGNTSTTLTPYVTASKTISVTTNHDPDAEDENFTLAFSIAGAEKLRTAAGHTVSGETAGTNISLAPAGPYNPTALKIKDDEEQTYVLALSPANQLPMEGTPVTVSLTALPAHEDGNGSVQVNIDKQGVGWGVAIAGKNADGADSTDNPTLIGKNTTDTLANSATVTINNPGNDGNRADDTVTVSAHTGVAGASMQTGSLTFTLTDVNKLQAVTAKVVDKNGKALDPQPTSVNEGDTIKIAVMPLDAKTGRVTTATEALDIALAPSGSADARDYRPFGAAIKIGAGQNMSNVVDLEVETDEDVGMETLVFDATVSGVATNGTETSTNAGVLSIDIEDATAKKITHKSDADTTAAVEAAIAAGGGDEGLNPGESFTVMMNDLFGPPSDGYTASYGASVSAGGVVSYSATGDSITVTAEKAGEATVTVTATAKAAMASATGSQSVSNTADVTFDVTVTDKVLTLTLDAPGAMDGNVVEGKGYDVTVTANRAVMGDTEVTFMRGDMSEADVRDYSIDAVTIMDGETTATARLMVTEDMTDDAGSGMGEALHLYAMAGDTMSNTLELTIWDEAVPALPLIAQLLLALFLMAGGSRLYRRRQG